MRERTANDILRSEGVGSFGILGFFDRINRIYRIEFSWSLELELELEILSKWQ